MNESQRSHDKPVPEVTFVLNLLGNPIEAFRFYEAQVAAVEHSGSALITLAGILIAITTAAAFSSEDRGDLPSVLIGIGTLLALLSSFLVVFGILRFQWATTDTLRSGQATATDLVVRIWTVRNAKTRYLNWSVVLLILSLAAYASAIFVLLF